MRYENFNNNKILTLEILLTYFKVQRLQALYDIDIKLNKGITRRSKEAKYNIFFLSLLIK